MCAPNFTQNYTKKHLDMKISKNVYFSSSRILFFQRATIAHIGEIVARGVNGIAGVKIT